MVSTDMVNSSGLRLYIFSIWVQPKSKVRHPSDEFSMSQSCLVVLKRVPWPSSKIAPISSPANKLRCLQRPSAWDFMHLDLDWSCCECLNKIRKRIFGLGLGLLKIEFWCCLRVVWSIYSTQVHTALRSYKKAIRYRGTDRILRVSRQHTHYYLKVPTKYTTSLPLR